MYMYIEQIKYEFHDTRVTFSISLKKFFISVILKVFDIRLGINNLVDTEINSRSGCLKFWQFVFTIPTVYIL